MSRHKLVKALDLDEELDDFDGGADSDYGEEVGAEDKGIYLLLLVPKMRTRVPACEPKTDSDVLEHLRLGTAKVRDVLGPEVSITDREIEDSLWHYYYDVDKTVNYLISTTW